MSKTFERYQRVLQNIPCHPDYVTSLELRQILLSKDLLNPALDEKSQMKTVQRIINKVAADYYCIEIDNDKRPHQIKISQGQQHPINPAAMSSVLSLQIIEHEVLEMLPPTMRKEVSNLISTGKAERDQKIELWKERFTYAPIEFQLTSPSFDESFIATIEQGIVEKRSLNMKYKKRGSIKEQQYHIEPLGIVLHGRSFYLVAVKKNTQQYRTFAIHRIVKLSLGFSVQKCQQHFNAKQYIEQHVPHFSGGEFTQVILKIDNYDGLHLIEETRLCKNQTTINSTAQHTTISAKVRDSLGFEWWLMKNANVVEVIEPIHIREKIKANLTQALLKYQ
ncbi:helix-turn-helix transcriptional regulator [Vibrio rarus]|uniref:helix-turn-helix transcriptional regulator n=1 Tax=Vibrio rarus TaxID=413403 RepID=UPI0021C2C318|nr:WYL domain-containing protein [Vibrio rarus]